MATVRTLKSIFSRFTPADAFSEKIFANAENAVLSGDREKKMYQVAFSLPFIVPKNVLYSLEEAICEVYDLQSVKLLPRYPKELFSLDYMPSVYTEAGRVGAVTKGFFDNCKTSLADGIITIHVNYTQGGVDFLQFGHAGDIVAGIIRSEFGIDFEVEIKQSDEYEKYYNEYLEKQAEFIRNYQETAQARHAEFLAREKEKAAAEPEKPQYEKVASLFEGTDSAQQIDENIIKVGKMTFNVEGGDILYGEGDFDATDPTVLRAINHPMKSCVALGIIFNATATEIRGSDNMGVSIGITDKDSSVFLKLQMPAEAAEGFVKSMKSGTPVAAIGPVRQDKNGDYNIHLKTLKKIKRITRQDNAPVKRVELHMHTNLSANDAIAQPKEVVAMASAFGHKAVAITDHGNVQGFPTAMLAANGKEDFKVIYGIEAYFVDDTARALYGNCDVGFDGEFIVFDLETTGLSPHHCKITEIGAVKVKDGEVLERFNTFVDPECPIPENIVELTGITDEMVKGAPKEKEALEAFFEFAGNRLLIAHNAGFDTSFVRAAADRQGMEFANSYLDTVSMSRYVNPELKKHKLDILAKHFQLGEFNHHRASDDAEMLALIFFCMLDKLRDEGITDFAQMTTAMSERADPLKLRTYHQKKKVLYVLHQIFLQLYV